MLPFTSRVIELIKQIPPGKISTYGAIARIAGNPRAARQVACVIHSCSRKYALPWHRVVNSRGRISLKEEGLLRQRELLKQEGVVVKGDKIELSHFLWQGPPLITP